MLKLTYFYMELYLWKYIYILYLRDKNYFFNIIMNMFTKRLSQISLLLPLSKMILVLSIFKRKRSRLRMNRQEICEILITT